MATDADSSILSLFSEYISLFYKDNVYSQVKGFVIFWILTFGLGLNHTFISGILLSPDIQIDERWYYVKISCEVGSQIKESTRWNCFSLFINQIYHNE